MIVQVELDTECLLLCGDANSRVGNQGDGKLHEGADGGEFEDRKVGREKKCDTRVNGNGNICMSYVHQRDLLITNG